MVCRDRLWFWRAELAPDPAHVVPEEGEAPEVAWGRALDAEALERSTCAHVDLAGGHVAESIFHRRAAPQRADVATATRTWTFRCADQKERAKWLKALRAATAAATRRARAASGDGDARRGGAARRERVPVRAAVHRVREVNTCDFLLDRAGFLLGISNFRPRHHARWRQVLQVGPGGTNESPSRRVSF